MKKILPILVLHLFLLFGKSSFASHIVGSEIMLNMTTATTGTVTVKIYRDCTGIPLCNCPPGPLGANCTINLVLMGASGSCNATSYGTFPLTVVTSAGVKDALSYCSQATSHSICNNCGTRTAGSYSPGAEVFTFSGPINLGAVPANCNKMRLTFESCCRNNAISNLANPSSLSFYTFLEFSRGLINSTPVFNAPPLVIAPSGVDQLYNPGASDADGDSLSYRFGTAMVAGAANAPYMAPYSATVPFPYLGAPQQSPPALPPLGISLNPTNGDIRFRPMGNFVAPLIIEVLEWRKINGVMTNIGISRRELQMYSTLVSAFPNPSINTYDLNIQSFATQPFQSYQVREGQQLCFVSVAGTSVSVDTTTFTAQIPSIMSASGATVTSLYDTATRKINGPRMDSVRFCWTPPVGFRRSYPYVFSLTATNSNCPVVGRTMRGFSIWVDSTNGILTPPTPPSSLAVTNNLGNSINLSWTNGSGSGSLVLARANNANFTHPTQGVAYSANSQFGMGSQVMLKSAGTYAVYNGTGNSVLITGLAYNTTYFFRVYTYNGTGSTTSYNLVNFASTNTQTLPVEFREFSVRLNENGKPEVNWSTATEINNERFEVERSEGNLEQFEKIGEKKGAGNSQSLMHYNLVDEKAFNGASGQLLYRIKQIDFDGSFDYSPIRVLNLNLDAGLEINPNPFLDKVVISNLKGSKAYRLLNQEGKAVQEGKLSADSQGQCSLDLSNLKTGVYLLEVDGKTSKLIKQ
ncbi:MAG: hypothetical protein LCH37_14390 [Bacteroidetes bacterium]|nr:hypothetical protein [Bacteroidota bacterium]